MQWSRKWALATLLLLTAALVACGQRTSAPELAATTKTPTPAATAIAVAEPSYLSTADLEGQRTRGVIRLLAPRFDRAASLPRQGLATEAYQALAELFVRERGLQPRWVFVDRFDDLLPALNRGEGDLVVTNMTVTQARLELAAFSMPIKSVDEVLVTPTPPASRDALESLTVAVPEGSAYVDTLKALGDLRITQTLLPSTMAAADRLTAVSAGEYAATLIDSDMAEALLPLYPALHLGPSIKRHRQIAWAVRPANTELLASLNEFLVSQHIQEAHSSLALRDWPQIKEQKVLRMLTLNNPASYFLWRGELMGFDYDLIKEFARQHQLHLSVVVKNDIQSLLQALRDGEGDLVAASLTATEARAASGLVFSRPYLKVREQLVGAAGKPKVAAIGDLAGTRIGVNPQTSFLHTLEALQQQVALDLVEVPGATTEELIGRAATREFDYVIADSHLAGLEKNWRDNIEVYYDLGAETDIAWALRPEQPELLKALNGYIKKHYRGLFYNVTYNKYFEDKRRIKRHSQHRVKQDSALSPYDELTQKYAREHNFDWRLITAQMYQESRFNPKAKSFAGALGLMQVMPRTAREFGYQDLFSAENGMAAGAAYLHWLQARFPGDLPLDERLYFTLAAYNAGTGHVRDARRLARQLGKDPDRWFGNVEEAMLLLSQPQYAKQARFGYVRGSEPVHYVKAIRDRYLAYLNTH